MWWSGRYRDGWNQVLWHWIRRRRTTHFGKLVFHLSLSFVILAYSTSCLITSVSSFEPCGRNDGMRMHLTLSWAVWEHFWILTGGHCQPAFLNWCKKDSEICNTREERITISPSAKTDGYGVISFARPYDLKVFYRSYLFDRPHSPRSWAQSKTGWRQ